MIKYRFVCVKLHYHVWEVTPNKETLFPALVTLAVIVWKAHQPPVSQSAAPDEVQGGQNTLISSGPLSGCEGERRGCRATTTQEIACHVVFTPYLPPGNKRRNGSSQNNQCRHTLPVCRCFPAITQRTGWVNRCHWKESKLRTLKAWVNLKMSAWWGKKPCDCISVVSRHVFERAAADWIFWTLTAKNKPACQCVRCSVNRDAFTPSCCVKEETLNEEEEFRGKVNFE